MEGAATRGRALKAFSVRKEAKDHGGGGRIAGALDPGDKVVVTEDTVTRGTSLLEAALAIREAGGDAVSFRTALGDLIEIRMVKFR